MNDSYQESYQSWEIVDYEINHWPSSRRCNYIFHSRLQNTPQLWYWCKAGTNGNYTISRNYDTEHRCNCPQKYGPYAVDSSNNTNAYTAVCQGDGWISSNDYYYKVLNNSASAAWVRSHECPKGWGKYYDDPASKTGPYVQCAQGYVIDGERGEPIYGYVTRYRDVYYDYISTRISKI